MTTATQALRFWIPGSVTPKARARVTSRGTYLPHRYQNWRQMAELEIMTALSPSIRMMIPVKKAAVKIELHGFHRGDPDNLAGACLDALVSVGVLLDDRLGCVPRLVIEHNPKGDRGAWIEVTPR